MKAGTALASERTEWKDGPTDSDTSAREVEFVALWMVGGGIQSDSDGAYHSRDETKKARAKEVGVPVIRNKKSKFTYSNPT